MIVQDPEGREVAALHALLPALSGSRVLEIGCGDGRLTRRYAGQARSVLAIDPDAAAIASLKEEPPPGAVEARAIGIDGIDFPARAFDVVLFSWSL